MARSIAGLFPDRNSAERAIVDLKDSGFDPSRIGIVMRDKSEAQAVADEHGAAARSTEGAVAGGIIGGSLGAILVAVGALAIPGVGPFISGGVLASLVGGTAGWLVGGLAGLGIPKDEAEYYESQVEQGRALVTVDAQGRDDEARAIMLRNGAEDFQNRGTASSDYDSGASGFAASPRTVGTAGDVRVPVREEELEVGKRRVEEGRVHIHKDVVEEPETVNVELQREQVRVERVPFSGDRTGTGGDAFTERDIDVPVMGEEAVIEKRVQGVEEVRIHKDVRSESERVTDTVRKERVTVDGADDQGSISGSGTQARGTSYRSDQGFAGDAAENAGFQTERAGGAAGNAARTGGNAVRDTAETIDNEIKRGADKLTGR